MKFCAHIRIWRWILILISAKSCLVRLKQRWNREYSHPSRASCFNKERYHRINQHLIICRLITALNSIDFIVVHRLIEQMNNFVAGVHIHENRSSNIVGFIIGPTFDDSLRNFTGHPLTDGSCFLKALCIDYTPEESGTFIMIHYWSRIWKLQFSGKSCYVFLPIKEYIIDFILKRKDINNYLCIWQNKARNVYGYLFSVHHNNRILSYDNTWREKSFWMFQCSPEIFRSVTKDRSKKFRMRFLRKSVLHTSEPNNNHFSQVFP